MQHNSRFLIPFLSLLLVSAMVNLGDARKANEALLGGWRPIDNIKDPHVKEIAEFAVSEYNKQSKTSLKLVKVVKGESQVVGGMNYRLDLMATDGAAAAKTYEAVVWERAWENFMNLTSFNPVKGKLT